MMDLRVGVRTNDPIHFERLGMCFFEVDVMAAPKAGQYYLSGAIVEAYLAPNDLDTRYRIVKPTHRAHSVQAWERGDPIVHIPKPFTRGVVTAVTPFTIGVDDDPHAERADVP